MYDYVFYQILVLLKHLLSHHNLSCMHIYPHSLLKWKIRKEKKPPGRCQKYRMGRPLSPLQIHQKIICTRSHFHKKTSECWRRNPDTHRDACSIRDCAHMVHLGPWVAWTWEVHAALSYGNPSVVHPLWAPPTRAGGVCSRSQSVSTAQLSKGARINGHFSPLMSGQRLDTEENCNQRRAN